MFWIFFGETQRVLIVLPEQTQLTQELLFYFHHILHNADMSVGLCLVVYTKFNVTRKGTVCSWKYLLFC